MKTLGYFNNVFNISFYSIFILLITNLLSFDLKLVKMPISNSTTAQHWNYRKLRYIKSRKAIVFCLVKFAVYNILISIQNTDSVVYDKVGNVDEG